MIAKLILRSFSTLFFLFVVEDKGKEFFFLCVYSLSDSPFADCDALSPFYPSLIMKAAAVLCDLVIILMSCNKDFCT